MKYWGKFANVGNFGNFVTTLIWRIFFNFSDYNTKREYDKLLYKQEVHEFRKGRRLTDFDDTLTKLRKKQKEKYKETKPPPSQDHKRKVDFSFDDLYQEELEENKKMRQELRDELFSKNDSYRDDSNQYKRFEKLLEGSVYFRMLLILFMSSGPLAALALAGSDSWKWRAKQWIMKYIQKALNMYFKVEIN